MNKCPRADANDWRNVEVMEITCSCGETIEFWKGDEERRCSQCGKVWSRQEAEAQKKSQGR